jgi:hypothetical protein
LGINTALLLHVDALCCLLIKAELQRTEVASEIGPWARDYKEDELVCTMALFCWSCFGLFQLVSAYSLS